MQTGIDDACTVSWAAEPWFGNVDTTVEHSGGEAPSSYKTAATDCTATEASTVTPYGYAVDDLNEVMGGCGDANPTSLRLNSLSTGALDSLVMNTYGFPTTQALAQQTFPTCYTGTAAIFDLPFAEAAQRVTSNYVGDPAQLAAYNTVTPPSIYADTNMYVDANNIDVNSTYTDPLEHGVPDSPTLGTYRSTELEQLADHTTSRLYDRQSRHFSDFPSKYTDS